MSTAEISPSSSHRRPPAYRVPALEKGLDVLECLATEGVPMSQAQLARALDRGPSELFRILTILERRGYTYRDPESGAYGLTLRLFELGHAHSPYQGLLRAAERPMRALSDAVRESCHLSVLQRGRLLVLHQEESPTRVRVSVEVGSTMPVHQAASGRALLAAMEPERATALLYGDPEFARLSVREVGVVEERLEMIRKRGYEEAQGETYEGISDLAVTIGHRTGSVHAALAVAALPRDHARFVEELLPALRHCATTIAQLAGLHDRAIAFD